MIVFQENLLTDTEITQILDLWGLTTISFSDLAIHFYSIDLLPIQSKLTGILNSVFANNRFIKLRLQKYDESFIQMENFHGHIDIHNYIIFLNDDFEGGELEFENGLIIKPSKGSLVYFNNDEFHRVLPCIGERWTFTASVGTSLDIKFKSRTKHLI